MSLFGGGIFGGPGFGIPDITDPLGIKKTKKQVEMLFKDVETEGKKQGYVRASKEYESAFRRVENEYRETKKILDNDIMSNDEKIEALLVELERLEERRNKLEKKVKTKTQNVSDTYDIPIEQINTSMASGTLIMGTPSFSALDIICSYKERKMQKAEERGYQEARELYLEKIEKLKVKLEELKKKSSKKLKELTDMAKEIMSDIADEELKIAELQILLNQ